MPKRDIDERLEINQARINKLKQEQKKLLAEKSKQARNARTKRLIEEGALTEKAIGLSLDTPEKREIYFELLTETRPGRNGTTYTYGSYFHDEILKRLKNLENKNNISS